MINISLQFSKPCSESNPERILLVRRPHSNEVSLLVNL